ncbi:MAG: histidine--tRNA ligase [Actinobacteria bacterium]|nr:histidine--tRNA ligase [Actinomycetota bacterium]
MKIEAPRGTLDVLPAQQPAREAVIHAAESAAVDFGYRRIGTPTFEDTALFARTSGSGSDVVQKEMYTFEDRGGRSLTLRPEATAPIARAYLEHGLHREAQPVKTFLIGPMFRYSAPQKGRYREFWQLNFEAMGSADPAVDAELIQLFTEIARRAGVGYTRLALNSIGDRDCRPAYVERLREFLAARVGDLDEDARRKLDTSPLRVFDSKNRDVQRTLADAPTIGDSLCATCAEHFASVRAFLDAYGVEYELAPTLVRGLDYYTRTVFEFVNEGLDAAQSTICAGGRYDYLIEELGGPPTPGVGWAAGIERMVLSREGKAKPSAVEIFFAVDEPARRAEILPLVARLRASGRPTDLDYGGRSLKGQLTQAERSGAEIVVIVRAEGATIRRRGEQDHEASLAELERLL